MQRYALLNDRLSLVCGTGLESNPSAIITWTAPDGTEVVDSARYHLINGPDVVSLNFEQVVASDIGVWQCDVSVFVENYNVSNANSGLEKVMIGESIHHSIQLIAVGKLFHNV